MTRPSIKHSLIFLATIISISIIGVMVGIIVPSVRLILHVRHDVRETEGALEQEYKETRILRRSIREVGDITKKIAEYKHAFIHEGDELKLITELENIATTNHIDQTLQVDKTHTKRGATTKPAYVFSFNNRGTFADHVRYLRAIEQLPYYMNISALTWEKIKSTGGQQLLNLRFTGHIPLSDF